MKTIKIGTKTYEINEQNPYIQAATRIKELGKENNVDNFVATKMWELESGVKDEEQRVEFLHLINDTISDKRNGEMTLNRLIELM